MNYGVDDMERNEITEGIIWKQLLRFFFPIMVGTLVQQMYTTVDTIIVGRFVGKAALATVIAQCREQYRHVLMG